MQRPHKASRLHGHEGGFTLVELLVALALLSIIAVLVANGLSFGARVWERGYVGSEALNETQSLQGFFRRMIASLYPYVDDAEMRTQYVAFDGEPERMRFVAPALAQLPVPGMTRYEISVAQDAHSSDLILRWCSLDKCRTAADFYNEANRAVIAHDVTRIRFRYGAHFQPHQDWQSTWSGRTALPERIEVTLGFGEGKHLAWPDLVARTRVDKDARCTFDPVSRHCRRT